MNYLKEIFRLLYIFSFAVLILLYSTNSIMSAELKKWTEVSSNGEGIQFIDKESIKYKKGILSIMTRYSEVKPENQDIINSVYYELQIDCSRRLLKKESEKNWGIPEGKIMKQTIIESCSY